MLRKTTRALLEALDAGLLDPMTVITACLNQMGEDEVADMCETNELLETADDEDEDEFVIDEY